MPAYKDKEKSTWFVEFRYKKRGSLKKTDKKKKRGFATKKEALEWERNFLNSVENTTYFC